MPTSFSAALPYVAVFLLIAAVLSCQPMRLAGSLAGLVLVLIAGASQGPPVTLRNELRATVLFMMLIGVAMLFFTCRLDKNDLQ